MKKSLWITAAAMAVGIGMSAHAATNAALGQWSFETLSVGQTIPSRSSPLADPYGSWSADTNNGTAYITNAAPSGVTYPIAGGPGAKGLYFDGSVTNHYDMTSTTTNRYFTDFLLKPGQLEDSNLIPTDPSIHLAFFFNTSSNLVVWHGSGENAWVVSTNELVAYATNSWVRITIDQNYNAVNGNMLCPMFKIYVNGTAFSHLNGYTTANDFDYDGTGSGTWFPMRNPNAAGMNALVGMGIGMLDDVVTDTNLTSFASSSEIGIIASTFSSAYGTISPSGFQKITNGSPRVFTVMVADSMCYVTGLTTNGVFLTGSNGVESVVSNQWTVAYGDVLAGGTNFVAMFAAKGGTAADYLDNYFSISNGGDYSSFSEAASADDDLDLFSNYQEIVAGTDPTNPTSFLTISNISVDGSGNVVVTFEGSGTGMATNYIIYDANTVTGVYSSVTNFTKSGGTKNINLVPATPKKFYKLVTPDPSL